MKYSTMAIKILALREYGIIKSNAHFWKEFTNKKYFVEEMADKFDVTRTIDKLTNELGSSDYADGLVCIYDDQFPVISKKVMNNSEKPYLLFYKGDISLLNDLNKNIAVIGLIDPDEATINRESKIIRELVSNNLIVVSGLAKGCDTIAHKICIKEAGKTIAILPSQINKIYPAENQYLAEEIVNKNGLLLSEYYKEPRSRKESINRLIERDRLQAMFAKAVILTASYRKGEGDSGSRYAMEAAKRYGITRYVMYNSKTDKDNKKFGLNNDLVNNKDKEKIGVLSAKSIKEIVLIKNPDLQKSQIKMFSQPTLNLSFEYSDSYVPNQSSSSLNLS